MSIHSPLEYDYIQIIIYASADVKCAENNPANLSRNRRISYLFKRIIERKEGRLIEIIVHAPTSPEKEKELHDLAAKIHAQYIAYYINSKLSCPIEQKRQLIDAIAAALRERTK